MVNITLDFETKLKAQIERIEAASALEIVPVIVQRASTYASSFLVSGLLLSYLPARLIANRLPVWGVTTYLIDLVVWFLLGVVFALSLGKAKIFARLIPQSLKRESTLQMAESLFLREGVIETKLRLGILIAVFEFEKSVIVLADKGFNGVVPSEYWKKLGVTLAQDFNRKRPGDEFFEALTEIEQQVAPKFKHDPNDTNELADDLRKR